VCEALGITSGGRVPGEAAQACTQCGDKNRLQRLPKQLCELVNRVMYNNIDDGKLVGFFGGRLDVERFLGEAGGCRSGTRVMVIETCEPVNL